VLFLVKGTLQKIFAFLAGEKGHFTTLGKSRFLINVVEPKFAVKVAFFIQIEPEYQLVPGLKFASFLSPLVAQWPTLKKDEVAFLFIFYFLTRVVF